MSEGVGPALEQALAYHRAPVMLPAAHGRPLPEGMITLLRLAGGDQALASRCAESCGQSETEVVDAAVFFIQQVMFASGSDSYRVLGVNSDALESRIKEHYRWLVRWLHPDRDQDDWDSVYAERVNRAWQDVRRRSGESGSEPGEMAAAAEYRPEANRDTFNPAPRVRIDHIEAAAAPLISSRTAQRLPIIVLGGMGMLAGAVLMLMWYARPAAPLEVQATPAAVSALSPVPEPSLEGLSYVPAPLPLPDATAVTDEGLAILPTDAEGADLEPSPVVPFGATPASSKAVGAQDQVASAREVSVSAPAPRLQAAPSPPPRVSNVAVPARQAPNPIEVEADPSQRDPGRVLSETEASAKPAPTVMAPASAPQPAQTTPSPASASEAAGVALAGRFASAYDRGDINALMRLFTRDARNDRGGRDAIVFDYQSLFSESQERSLELVPSGWIGRDASATLIVRYEARVKMRGKLRSSVSRGTLRFDLRAEGDEVRISRISLDG